jgi:hypothetical protein
MVHGSYGASSAGKSGREMKSQGTRAVLFTRLAMVAVEDMTIASVMYLCGMLPSTRGSTLLKRPMHVTRSEWVSGKGIKAEDTESEAV